MRWSDDNWCCGWSANASHSLRSASPFSGRLLALDNVAISNNQPVFPSSTAICHAVRKCPREALSRHSRRR